MSKLFCENDYILGMRCPKLLWRHAHRTDNTAELSESRLSECCDLAALKKFCAETEGCIFINENGSAMAAAKTADAVASSDIIGAGTVIVPPLMCRFDMLRRRPDGTYTLYIVRAATHIRQSACHCAAYQIFVLAAKGIKVSGVEFVKLDPSYVSGSGTPLFCCEKISGRVFSLTGGVAAKLEKFLEIRAQKTEPDIDPHNGCFTPADCELCGVCLSGLPSGNVFDIGGMSRQTKFRLYRSGKVSLEEVLEDTSLTPALRNQISYAVSGAAPRIKKKKISEFLNSLSYPLCFLDFESMQLPMQPFDGLKPFEAVAFQYSLHILKEPFAHPIHKSCIVPPGTDPRRPIAESLCRDIPDGACTAAYNMQLERQITASLAQRFPDLREKLLTINKSMKDMMEPFLKGYYYAPLMNGSYSLKKVLRALYPDEEELDYSRLEGVHNGKEAALAYALISMGDSSCNTDTVLKELDAYCALDTLALVKLHEKLLSSISPAVYANS